MSLNFFFSNFNFFGASDARRVNSQHLYTLVKVLRVFHQCCGCFIRVADVLSVLRVFNQGCECFISVASVSSVLRMFYKCCECFIKKRLFGFSSTSIYQTSIVCTPFSMNRHINMLAVSIPILAYKHRVYGVLVTNISTCVSF